MNRNARSKRHTLPQRLVELSIAAPQVVAQRLTRIAAAGPTPSARDRREMHRMGAEKVAAFWESWAAMTMQGWAAQQRALLDLQGTLWRSWLAAPRATSAGDGLRRGATALQNASLDVLAHGLAPVHRRAVANAKRLGRTPRR